MSEQAYLDLLRDVLENGRSRSDRTGTGTRSVFGRQIRFDLSKGFPLLTTKKVFLRGIIEELLWFLRGSTNAKELEDKGVNIWREWGDPVTRELGRVYGAQWRSWQSPAKPTLWDRILGRKSVKTVDQIKELIDRLKQDPNSRRHLVVAWNPGEVDGMALPPCHCLFQFYVRPLTLRERDPGINFQDTPESEAFVSDLLDQARVPRYALDCQLYQRSADIFLGVPFNIASYALLTMMIATECGYRVGEFVHTFGDLHLYNDHVEQAKLQLERQPRQFPKMMLRAGCSVLNEPYSVDDFVMEGYDPHPAIKAQVSK